MFKRKMQNNYIQLTKVAYNIIIDIGYYELPLTQETCHMHTR